ncbi:hypothetical protein HK104_002572, partial [Borealophlyctis nickersoniae]
MPCAIPVLLLLTVATFIFVFLLLPTSPSNNQWSSLSTTTEEEEGRLWHQSSRPNKEPLPIHGCQVLTYWPPTLLSPVAPKPLTKCMRSIVIDAPVGQPHSFGAVSTSISVELVRLGFK